MFLQSVPKVTLFSSIKTRILWQMTTTGATSTITDGDRTTSPQSSDLCHISDRPPYTPTKHPDLWKAPTTTELATPVPDNPSRPLTTSLQPHRNPAHSGDPQICLGMCSRLFICKTQWVSTLTSLGVHLKWSLLTSASDDFDLRVSCISGDLQ